MTVTVLPPVEQVRLAVKKFEQAQEDCRRYGARDTEPDSIFQVFLSRAANGLRPATPAGVVGWELYGSMNGSASAAARLTAAAESVRRAVESCPVGDHANLMLYVNAYCWRVY